ncbi:MAG TPA: FG-GAP repeat protein, partial [Pyrinomonadaceae bacterium]|nr:FG-GAP repeat protein [Pyrinomonadaceae bacterium]
MLSSPKLLVASILVGAMFLTMISWPRIGFARVNSSSVPASVQNQMNREDGRLEPCTERGNDDKRRDEGRGSDDDGCLATGSSSGIVRGDFNADQIADLAIGVPGEDIDGIENAGAVHVIYGTTAGLSSTAGPGDQFFPKTLNPFGIVRAGDGLGTSLASGDFNGDGASDLAVSTPSGEVDGILRAGYVQVLYGSEAGLALGTIPLENISQRT